jgi:four helix bundle protein
MKKYLKVEDVRAYQLAIELADCVWSIVIEWDYFSKKTVGIQYVNAVDSISANIAEGWGRFHKKDKMKFFYNARGSVEESKDWTDKGYKRKLLKKEEYKKIKEILKTLPREINFLISITNEKLTF